MLPKMPDRASFHDKALESATRAKAVVVAITVDDGVADSFRSGIVILGSVIRQVLHLDKAKADSHLIG